MSEISEKAKDLFKSAAEQVPDIVASVVLEGIVGSVLPGVAGAVLAYRQKRQERMYCEFLEQLKARVGELAEKLEKLDPEQYEDIKSKYFGLVSDYVLDEVQEDKIHFIVNGFSNLASAEHISEDFVLTYYDTLHALRMIDIAVLKRLYNITYMIGEVSRYEDFCREMDIDDDQYRAIREKLERMGLVITKRAEKEDNLYHNISIIENYLKEIDKSTRSKSAKIGNLKSFKRIERDTYKTSRFGANFVRFFIENQNM